MFCENCGSQLSDNAKFCTKCGNKIILEDFKTPQIGERAQEITKSVPNRFPVKKETQKGNNENYKKLDTKNTTIGGCIALAIIIIIGVPIYRGCSRFYEGYSEGKRDVELKEIEREKTNEKRSKMPSGMCIEEDGKDICGYGLYNIPYKVPGREKDSLILLEPYKKHWINGSKMTVKFKGGVIVLDGESIDNHLTKRAAMIVFTVADNYPDIKVLRIYSNWPCNDNYGNSYDLTVFDMTIDMNTVKEINRSGFQPERLLELFPYSAQDTDPDC